MAAHPAQAAVDAAAASRAGPSRVLAAFCARSLVYAAAEEAGAGAAAAAPPTAAAVLALAAGAGVSSSTLRLQAAFDAALFAAHRGLEGRRHALRRRVVDLGAAIAEATLPAATAAARHLGGADGTGPAKMTAPGRSTSGATPAVLQGLQAVRALMVDYCCAVCAADPAAAGVRPAAAAGPAGVGSGAGAGAGAGGGSVGLLDYIAAVQRDVAAALESVLPRAQLQHFAEASPDEQTAQLSESALLVLGIRLYNWEAGKSPHAGLAHAPQLAAGEARALLRELEQAAAQAEGLAAQYADVLAALRAGAGARASAEELRLWPLELANRRQLATHAQTLAEEVRALLQGAEEAQARFGGELGALKRAVAAAAGGAVSKEAVYPRFRAMAEAWLQAAHLRGDVAVNAAVLEAVRPFAAAASAPCTLGAEAVRQARLALAAGKVPPAEPLAPPPGAAGGDAAERVETPSAGGAVVLELAGFCAVSLATPVDAAAAAAGAAAVVPGVLRHGDFGLGLARWRGRLFALAGEPQMAAFLAAPAFFLGRVRALCLRHPELVHVLQCFDRLSPAERAAQGPEAAALRAALPAFPYAALSVLAQFDGDLAAAAAAIDAAPLEGGEGEGAGGGAPDGGAGAGAEPAAMTAQLSATTATGAALRMGRRGVAVADAAVATPVHFVERHIDRRYEFSEWALRRRALQLANLRKCATHSAQTDGSHFRRDNDTQVYLQRAAETQTLHGVATNTERTVSYISGVRGVPEPFVEAAARNRAVGKPALPSSKSRAPERLGAVAVKVDNIIDECQDPGDFRQGVARVDGGVQTSE